MRISLACRCVKVGTSVSRVVPALVVAGLLLADRAFADNSAIVFVVYRTTDAQEIIAKQGRAGLTSPEFQDRAIARGFAKPGSTTWIKTAAFRVKVMVAKSPVVDLETDEYEYNLVWHDEKENKDIYCLRGKIKPCPEGALPEEWEKGGLTAVFVLENWKQ